MAEAEPGMSSENGGILSNVFQEIISSPLNIGLVFIISFLVYKIFKLRLGGNENELEVEKPLPKMKKRDFTIEELKQYDGNQKDGRVLVAVNGKVFDVTKGKRFYGPGKYCFYSRPSATSVILLSSNLTTQVGPTPYSVS